MQVTSSSYANAVYAVQATQTPRKTASVDETQQLTRLEQMQEKYKDVYTPIPESYSAEDEAFQQQKILDVYPNYISLPDFMKIVDSFYDGEPVTLGTKSTQEQRDKQAIAFQKTYDLFGGKEKVFEMFQGAKKIMEQSPINRWGKDERTHNEKELARFYNASVYEGLEQGKNVNEAKRQATSMMYTFMDTSYAYRKSLDRQVKMGFLDAYPENDKQTVQKEIDFNDPSNSTMDLREYGIEGYWENHKIIENQDAILQEIMKKIGQFNFMLNNESLIKEAYMKLDGSTHYLGNNSGYKRWINEDLMPKMQFGYTVFSQYTIYDSIDLHA